MHIDIIEHTESMDRFDLETWLLEKAYLEAQSITDITILELVR
jgi:hypothetical protein